MNKTTEALKLAHSFCAELVTFGGKYPYINGTEVVRDAYKISAAIREALAEQEKQEPVAVISESAIGLVKLHSSGACLPFGTQLYAAPVSAEAIRSEALEQAAKVCEEVANRYKTGADLEHKLLQVGFLSAERCAYDIRAKDAK